MPAGRRGLPQDPESTQLSNEVISALVTAAVALDRPAGRRLVKAAGHLSWSNHPLTATVRAGVGAIATPSLTVFALRRLLSRTPSSATPETSGARGARGEPGGVVERRSLISDAGRSMGEAMAGVSSSGRNIHAWTDGDEKSDHFVGECYAEYVASLGSFAGRELVDVTHDAVKSGTDSLKEFVTGAVAEPPPQLKTLKPSKPSNNSVRISLSL